MGVAHHLTIIGGIALLPQAIGSKAYFFHLVYQSLHGFEWYRVTN